MTLTWLLYELSRHTNKQDKLYKELDSVSQEDIMTADKLDNLLYLDACVKEILRYSNNIVLIIGWFATFVKFCYVLCFIVRENFRFHGRILAAENKSQEIITLSQKLV